MQHINYKSDFECVLRLKDLTGKEVPFPECDWEAVFWTWSKAKCYRASCRAGVYTNCYFDGEHIHVVFDNHGLSMGLLHWEIHLFFPDRTYPDGTQDLYHPMPLDIELIHGGTPCISAVEAEARLPYIKVDLDNLSRRQRDEIREVCAGDYDFSDDFNNDFSN